MITPIALLYFPEDIKTVNGFRNVKPKIKSHQFRHRIYTHPTLSKSPTVLITTTCFNYLCIRNNKTVHLNILIVLLFCYDPVNCIPYTLMCPTCLALCVLFCLTCSCVSHTLCPKCPMLHMPRVLHALVSHVPCPLCDLMPYVTCTLRFYGHHVPLCPLCSSCLSCHAFFMCQLHLLCSCIPMSHLSFSLFISYLQVFWGIYYN